MATITSDTYLDGGTARTAGESFAIGSGAKFTIRTDSRIHANAPAGFTGTLGNPTFTDIGGELIIDATAVRWLAFSGGSSTVPSIGTLITQGAVSGYLLGVWAAIDAAPLAAGAAMPSTGFIKFREVTGGTYSTGALAGITADATGSDKQGWVEIVLDSGVNFVVPRVGKFSSRGGWFELGETNGAAGQLFSIPSTSSKSGFNYFPGAWVETAPGSDSYEFWPSLNGAANGWSYRSIGYPLGSTDKRGQFFRNLWSNGKLSIGQNYNLKATYASVAAQASTYAGLAIAATYTWSADILRVDGGANAHFLEVGDQCGFDFTTGSATDQILTVTKVIDAYIFECSLAGSGTGGNVTLRPGVTVTFTAHGMATSEWVGCDFTTGSGADGTYRIGYVTSANAYVIRYPHTAALTSGNVSVYHTITITTPTAITVTDIALAATYSYTGYIITFVATGHQLLPGMTVGVDFLTGGLSTDANYQVLEVIDANTFTCLSATASGTAGTATIRPGVIIAHTGHGKAVGDSQFYNFAATVADGEYPVYAVDSADQYKISVPHLVAYAGTTCGIETGLAVGNKVYLDFSSGAGIDGIYVIKSIAAGSFTVNLAHTAAIPTSNVDIKLTEGYIPPSGCKVRIPNIILNEAGTARRDLNLPPNATIASRPEFTTTTAGAVDLEFLYGNYYLVIAQAFSLRLRNVATFDSVSISEVASALDIDGLGVGMFAAQDLRSVVFTSCFAGGTVSNVTAMRGNLPGATDHSFEVLYCTGIIFNNIRTGIVQFARSTGAVNISTSQQLTFNGLVVLNANILVASCVDAVFNNTDYSDRLMGMTNGTTAYYAFVMSAGSNGVTINGLTFGLQGAALNVHPLSGLISYAACLNLRFRNIGTRVAPLKLGNFMESLYNCATPFVTSGNCSNIKIQRVYVDKCRTSLFTATNSDKNVIMEDVDHFPFFYGVSTGTPKVVAANVTTSLNGTIRALRTGSLPTSGQTSVYGTHWFDMFQGSSRGAIILVMNEPTADTASQVTINSGVVKFNAVGGVEMRAIGAQATWEMPFFVQGHTAFQNTAPVMSGGTASNYTLEYQIDLGAGYSAWKALTGANLSAEILTATGFKLKLRVTTAVTNATAITFIRLPTVMTEASLAAISYPLETVPVKITALDASTGLPIQGAHVYLVASAGGALTPGTVILDGISDAAGAALNSGFELSGISQPATGRIRKSSASPFYKTAPISGNITSIGMDSTVFMVGDE